MKKTQRTSAEVKAEILAQAKMIHNDPTAQIGSMTLAVHIDYMRKLLKELAACKEE